MISIPQIAAIAKYERKTLLRSWFFRIFAILSFTFIGFWNLSILVMPQMSMGAWIVRALPANIPYNSLLLLNVVQAVVSIFLASDFLKQDSKLDTTDVIYVRSMSNMDYVIGKTLGNIGVFLILNLLILAVTLILNILSSTTVNVLAYIEYFLLISIPTLVFIMGLSFLLMSLLKNQAITFLIMLGYVALSLFYLKSKFYYIFDYMAYSIPMSYSDFVGFGNIDILLNHRGMYLFFGLSFICFTIMMLTRLSHSKLERKVSGILAVLFLSVGIFMGYTHLNRLHQDESLRKQLIQHNDSLQTINRVYVSDYQIDLKHEGNQIAVRAKLQVRNKMQESNDSIVFSLNPGLKLDSLYINGESADFEQKLGSILIKKYELKPWQKATLEFVYHGSILESAAYLDIDKEEFEKLNTEFLFQIDKRYAFLTPNYVLLTRENAWYPIPGAGFGKTNLNWLNSQFSNYSLKVETNPNLTAISQGSAEHNDSSWSFKSTHANSQISLVIGDYERTTQEIDGLEFNLYVKKGHDYYTDFFETIQDTLSSVIAETLQDYERSLDLYYPFERFSLVEVPVQFYSYQRVLSAATEYVQPEMVLFGEKGALSDQTDFQENYRREKGGGPGGGPPRRRTNQMTDEELRMQVFRNFASSFFSSSGRPDFSRSGGQVEVSESVNPYYVFPLFYDYAYAISSTNWPVSNKVFGAYKESAAEDEGMGGWMRNMNGMTNDEKANVALLSHSFEELLQDPDQKDVINDVIELKGTSLVSIIREKVGDEAFDDFLYDYLYRHQFKTATLESFAGELRRKFHLDLISYMKDWFKSKELPAYLLGEVEAVNVLDKDELKTMVTFRISNIEPTEGVVEVEFRTGGGPRMMGGDSDNITKLIHLAGNQTKEITMLLSGNPRGGTINTLTSKNVPSQIRIDWGRLEEDDKITPHEGEKIIDDQVKVVAPGEIVVDNEDKEFEITTLTQGSRLRKWLLASDEEKSKYSSFHQWRPPLGWTLTTNSDFYGTNIRSAYYTAVGDGDQVAKWHVPLQGEGFYSVYVYLFRPWRWRRDKIEFDYQLTHAGGVEKIPVRVKDKGWYYLGAYYFKSDTALIELSNQSRGKMVVADAVKFVKQ
ncbi:MAG: M1 family aminopeptidase [Mangrovibacterium sp.]